MRCKNYIIVALLACAIPSASAIYRCENAAGKLSFQDAPCPANSRQASIEVTAPTPPKSPSTAINPQTTSSTLPTARSSGEVERLNQESERLRKFNRLQDLNNLHVASARVAIERLQQECRSEMQALSQRRLAVTNEATRGMTTQNEWATAMAAQANSSEMQAIAARCGVEQQAAQMEYDRLRNEKMQLERELGM